MTTLIRVKALVAFSEYVRDHGVVHGDPNSTDERARFPLVPASKVDELIDLEWIKEADPLDHDGDGKKGGSKPAPAPGADKRKAALAKANAARAAKAAERKAAAAAAKQPDPAPPAGESGSQDAPPVD